MNSNLTLDDVVWRLAQLASLPFQERYCVNGTANEYFLDHELLQDVDVLEVLIDRPENSDVLNVDQQQAVRRLLDIVAEKADSALPSQRDRSFVRDSRVWCELRDAAELALKPFGISAANMSAEEINRLNEEGLKSVIVR